MCQNHFHMLQCHNCIRLSLKHTDFYWRVHQIQKTVLKQILHQCKRWERDQLQYFIFFNVCACTNWWLSLPNLFSFAPILMSTPPEIISTPVISIWKHITHHILRHPAGKHWTPTTIHNTTYNTYGNRMTWWNRGTNCNSQLHCPCPDWVWEFPLNISPSRVQPLQDFTLTPHSDVNPPWNHFHTPVISTYLITLPFQALPMKDPMSISQTGHSWIFLGFL